MTTIDQLLLAIRDKKIKVLKKLLSTVTWNKFTKFSWEQVLAEAATGGHYSTFLCILDAFPSYETKLAALKQSIPFVARAGHLKIFKFIIRHFYPRGSEARKTLIEGSELKDALFLASESGHREIVQRLIALHPNATLRLKALQNEGGTFSTTNGSLHNAIHYGHSEIVYLLISKYPATKRHLLIQDKHLLKQAVYCGKPEIVEAVLGVYTDANIRFNEIKNQEIFYLLLNNSKPNPKIFQLFLNAASGHKDFRIEIAWPHPLDFSETRSISEDSNKNRAVVQILQMILENSPLKDRLDFIQDNLILGILIRITITVGNIEFLKSILDTYAENRATIIYALFYLDVHCDRQNDYYRSRFRPSLEGMAAANKTDMVQVILDFLLLDANYLDSTGFFDSTELLSSEPFNHYLFEALQKENCPERLIQFAQRPLPKLHHSLLEEMKKSSCNPALLRFAKQPALRKSIINSLFSQASELLHESKANEAYDLLASAIHVEEDGSLITPLAEVVQTQLPTQSHSWFHRQRDSDPEVANIKLWMKQIIQSHPAMRQNRVNQNTGMRCW